MPCTAHRARSQPHAVCGTEASSACVTAPVGEGLGTVCLRPTPCLHGAHRLVVVTEGTAVETASPEGPARRGQGGFAKEGAAHRGRCGPLAGEERGWLWIGGPADSLRQGTRQRGRTSKSPPVVALTGTVCSRLGHQAAHRALPAISPRAADILALAGFVCAVLATCLRWYLSSGPHVPLPAEDEGQGGGGAEAELAPGASLPGNPMCILIGDARPGRWLQGHHACLIPAQPCAWDFLVRKRGLTVGSPSNVTPGRKAFLGGSGVLWKAFWGCCGGRSTEPRAPCFCLEAASPSGAMGDCGPEAPSLGKALPQGPWETTGWVVGPQVQMRRWAWRAPPRMLSEGLSSSLCPHKLEPPRPVSSCFG